jgi:protein TonB
MLVLLMLVAGCASEPATLVLVPLQPMPRLRYPPAMLQQGREGDVTVECTITTTGTTKDCVATRSAGGIAFIPAAIDFETQVRFEPVLRDGVPVEVPHHPFQVAFRLGR